MTDTPLQREINARMQERTKHLIRNDVIEECAASLAIWYPGHASTNAFCAALRSMKRSHGDQCSGRENHE